MISIHTSSFPLREPAFILNLPDHSAGFNSGCSASTSPLTLNVSQTGMIESSEIIAVNMKGNCGLHFQNYIS
jgi:hypothetical protein